MGATTGYGKSCTFFLLWLIAEFNNIVSGTVNTVLLQS